MTVRGITWFVFMTAGGILSAGVTLYGVYQATVVDFRADTVLVGLYCLLLIPCLPVFILVRPPRRSAGLLALLVIAFVAAYSALNRRPCSELGYCGAVFSTVLETLGTRPVLTYLAATILSFGSYLAEEQPPAKRARQ